MEKRGEWKRGENGKEGRMKRGENEKEGRMEKRGEWTRGQSECERTKGQLGREGRGDKKEYKRE